LAGRAAFLVQAGCWLQLIGGLAVAQEDERTGVGEAEDDVRKTLSPWLEVSKGRALDRSAAMRGRPG
jgi:hypothetical protein